MKLTQEELNLLDIILDDYQQMICACQRGETVVVEFSTNETGEAIDKVRAKIIAKIK